MSNRVVALPWIWPVEIVEWPQQSCPQPVVGIQSPLLRYGACCSSLLWKPCPPPPHPRPLCFLQTVHHSWNKSWLVLSSVGEILFNASLVFGEKVHICVITADSSLPAPKLARRPKSNKCCSLCIKKKKIKFKFTGATALNIRWQLLFVAGCELLTYIQLINGNICFTESKLNQ